MDLEVFIIIMVYGWFREIGTGDGWEGDFVGWLDLMEFKCLF